MCRRCHAGTLVVEPEPPLDDDGDQLDVPLVRACDLCGALDPIRPRPFRPLDLAAAVRRARTDPTRRMNR